MRKLYFLVPGTTGQFGGGGLWAELKTMELAQQICPAELVTYRQRENQHLFLPDCLRTANPKEVIFVLSWGFDVAKLSAQLRSYHQVYHAHSCGYPFTLPPEVPIITVSRNTMGYWGQKSSQALIYYLPNQISDEFCNQGQVRDIDVLVQARKSSEYLLKALVPALRQHCQVEVVSQYVEDLAGLFNRTKIYLYDSAEYWALSGVTEGFGLPPLEALACGCQVFSSVNHALADYLDPGFNCYKIAGYSREYDMQRILHVLKSPVQLELPSNFFDAYRTPALLDKLRVILTEINAFFDHKPHLTANIQRLTQFRRANLFIQKAIATFRKRFHLYSDPK
jgi:hypothetical protein